MTDRLSCGTPYKEAEVTQRHLNRKTSDLPPILPPCQVQMSTRRRTFSSPTLGLLNLLTKMCCWQPAHPASMRRETQIDYKLLAWTNTCATKTSQLHNVILDLTLHMISTCSCSDSTDFALRCAADHLGTSAIQLCSFHNFTDCHQFFTMTQVPHRFINGSHVASSGGLAARWRPQSLGNGPVRVPRRRVLHRLGAHDDSG